MDQELKVLVLCALDRRPVKAALVRRVISSGGTAEGHVASDDGLVQLGLAGTDGIEIAVQAPGYESWRGIAQVAESGPFEVLIGGKGRIVVQSHDGGGVPPATTATASQIAIATGGTVVRRGVRLRDGRVRIDALRPGHYYEVLVMISGTEPVALSPVLAGWPAPTKLEVHAESRSGHEILIDGIVEADCGMLRVLFLNGGVEGFGSRPEWDAIRKLGVAVPVSSTRGQGTELLVRGPLGVLLYRGSWAPRGTAARVELDLRRERVGLLVPDGYTVDPNECIVWRADGRLGVELAPRRESLEMLYSSQTTAGAVDLRWGSLHASGVSLPREDPIEFSTAALGELMVRGVGSRTVSVLSHPRGEPQTLEVDAVGDQVRATVAVGAYRVLVDQAPVGALVHVHPNEVSVVSLAEMSRSAALELKLPEKGTGGVVSGEGLVVISQANSGKRHLRRSAFSGGTRIVTLPDLPPGEVFVRVRSATLGFAMERAVLRAGETTTVTPSEWSFPREVTFYVEDEDGVPRKNLALQIALESQGRSSTVRIATDPGGEAKVMLMGGGRILVGTRHGFFVKELGTNQTYMRISPDGQQTGSLTVSCRGWWADKAKAVGVLRGGPGGTAFIPGRSGGEPGVFVVPRRGKFVLVVMLRDRSKVFVVPEEGRESMVLDARPPAVAVSVVLPGEGVRPSTLLTRLERVGGIDVRGTSFASALGRAHAFGDTLTLRQGAPMQIVMDAAASHGGIVWRSAPTRIQPGRPVGPIQLEIIE